MRITRLIFQCFPLSPTVSISSCIFYLVFLVGLLAFCSLSFLGILFLSIEKMAFLLISSECRFTGLNAVLHLPKWPRSTNGNGNNNLASFSMYVNLELHTSKKRKTRIKCAATSSSIKQIAAKNVGH